ncbi:MAG: heme exporter protein CcmB [Pseudomonadota bacterium]
MRGFLLVLIRDLSLALRQSSDVAAIVMFFVLTVVIFPFGVGPEPSVLERIAPGILWVTALLAAMLSLERQFLADYEDGSLELLVLTPVPLELVALAKAAAHWLTTGVPLVLAAPILGVVLRLPPEATGTLIATLALGTPTLSLIGGIGAALTLGSRRGGVLISLLVIPLFIPVLIFGAAAVDAVIAGFSVTSHLMVLGGMLLGALVLAPWATAAAVRQAVE